MLKFNFLLLLFLYCLTDFGAVDSDQDIIVHTLYGRIRSQVHKLYENGREIDVFYGIPFARAKRFEKPEPPEKWDGVRSAIKYPPACIPHARPELYDNDKSSFSEDCLFLNIFSPHRNNQTKLQNALFPVLFVIHGGAFEMGSAMEYVDFNVIGPRFVSNGIDGQGIVFVAIQYRLGVMGFATTEDDEMPGNLGIWDQIAALEYVRDNIKAFGGDPERVTVYGYSAGSGSTGLLSISPKSRDLFHQAIRMSGSVLSGSGSGTFVANETRKLAKGLGCPPSDSIKKCLSSMSINQMFDAMEIIGPAPLAVDIAKFSPNHKDRELFPEDYPQLTASSPPKKMILGFTELDFLLFTGVYSRNNSISMLALTDQQIANYGQKSFELFVREVVVKEDWLGPDTDRVKCEIADFYVNQYQPKAVKDRDFYLRLYAMVLSDLMDIVPILWEAEIRTNAGWSIYFYENMHYNPVVFNRSSIHAAYHGFDHSLIFEEAFTKLFEQDRLVSDYLVATIRNFVINGDPTTPSVKWDPMPKFSLNASKSLAHLQVKAPKSAQIEGLQGELKRAQFWRELTKKYGQFDLVRNVYQNGTTKMGMELCQFLSILMLIFTLFTFFMF